MEKDTDMEKDIELQKFIMLSQGIGTIFYSTKKNGFIQTRIDDSDCYYYIKYGR